LVPRFNFHRAAPRGSYRGASPAAGAVPKDRWKGIWLPERLSFEDWLTAWLEQRLPFELPVSNS
jgi:hypothetical protein